MLAALAVFSKIIECFWLESDKLGTLPGMFKYFLLFVGHESMKWKGNWIGMKFARG